MCARFILATRWKEIAMVTKAVPLSGDGGVLVEVSSEVLTIQPAVLDGGRVAGVGDQVVARMAAVGNEISRVCSDLFDHIKSNLGEKRPDELTLEFALALGGEAGVPFVTKGKAEATFTV